jgi:hypothetical protein
MTMLELCGRSIVRPLYRQATSSCTLLIYMYILRILTSCALPSVLIACGKTNKQDQVTRADKALAEAMTLGQEIKPADPKSRQGVLHTVCFARTLRLLAKLMRKEEQAVSAEGLLRNAIDSLEAIPNGTSSDKLLRPTHAYELVHTWNDFANLLDEWDKRESEAEAYRTKAKTYAHVDAHLNRLQFTFNVNLGWSL